MRQTFSGVNQADPRQASWEGPNEFAPETSSLGADKSLQRQLGLDDEAEELKEKMTEKNKKEAVREGEARACARAETDERKLLEAKQKAEEEDSNSIKELEEAGANLATEFAQGETTGNEEGD
eukprot:jgi/Bigna1/80879/fgenesh1_pg.75_\